jgi:hypothetical protein
METMLMVPRMMVTMTMMLMVMDPKRRTMMMMGVVLMMSERTARLPMAMTREASATEWRCVRGQRERRTRGAAGV